MSELNDRIKALVAQYPGSKSELARLARIDRSTLYKILNGQRLPTETQLQDLLTVLPVSQGEYASLTQLFSSAQHTDDQQRRFRLIQRLIASVFGTQKTIKEAEGLFESGTVPLSPPAYLHGAEEISRFLKSWLLHYLRSESEEPLMLSPMLTPAVVRTVVQVFSQPADAPKTLWQLCLFEQEGAGGNIFEQNLQVLAQVAPFLFVGNICYEARLSYAAQITLPGLPLPVYLLFPDLCLFLDEEGRNAVCIHDRDSVAFIRLQYSRQYLRAPNARFLNARLHSAEECMAQTHRLTAAGGPAFWLRDQPPLVGCLDPAMVAEVLQPGAPSAAAGLQTLLDRQRDMAALEPCCYFTEEGVLRFLHTGQVDDVPDDLYRPLPPDLRRTLLRRLRDQCACDRQTLRLLNGSALPVAPGVSMDVYLTSGVLLCQQDRTKTAYRHCFLQERTVTEALFLYLSELRTSQLVCSQKYTLEFLDYCLHLPD